MLNVGLGEAKTAVAAGVTGVAIIAAPESGGSSLFAAGFAGYTAVSSQGQVLSGMGQLYTAATGDIAPGQGIQQVGDIMSGPLTGVPTLIVTQDPAKAQNIAGYESLITAGGSFLENQTVAQGIASAIDMALSTPAVRSESICDQ